MKEKGQSLKETFSLAHKNFKEKKLNSPNDLAFDKKGRLWFTDPRYGDKVDNLELDHQSVFRADPLPNDTWNLTRVTYDTTKPNGLLISPDQKVLYVAQSEYKLKMECGWDYTLLPPSVIKKFATDKGNANKDLMLDAFEKDTSINLAKLFDTTSKSPI